LVSYVLSAPEACWTDEFPFDHATFKRSPIPLHADPADAKRAADIHVKIPSHLSRPEEYAAVGSAVTDSIKGRLLDCGFYEILSEAGNYMYSAHFSDHKESRLAFEQLDQFARASGVIVGVAWETCVRVWRKHHVVGQKKLYAEVPPHLSFRN
jgi:hypothetical protein